MHLSSVTNLLKFFRCLALSQYAARKALILSVALLAAVASGACNRESLPDLPSQLQELADGIGSMPGVPESLTELSGMLEDLGLPDIGRLANVPQLADLPVFRDDPTTISFNGPIERTIAIGETIPGTSIQLTAVDDEGADFLIEGLHSARVVGDSLDYDGAWPTAPGITYNLRLRLYRIGEESVRAAGVHQLTIRDIDPQPSSIFVPTTDMKFPFTINIGMRDTFKGTTLGYAGWEDRGAQLTGLGTDEYPFRKVGDSVQWSGALRNDVSADFNLRMMNYGDSGARIGGLVTVGIPQP